MHCFSVVMHQNLSFANKFSFNFITFLLSQYNVIFFSYKHLILELHLKNFTTDHDQFHFFFFFLWFYHLFCDYWSVKHSSVNILINTDYSFIFFDRSFMLTVNKTESEKSRSFFKTNWLNSKRVNLCQPYGLFVEHLQIAHSFVFLHLKEELKNSENFLQGRPPKNDQIIGCPFSKFCIVLTLI